MKFHQHLTLFATLLALTICLPAAHAQSPRDTAVENILRAMEDRRYNDAATAINNLMAASPDAAAYEARGALALHVRDIRLAERDFAQASAAHANNDAFCAYGLGLCALFRKDYPEARKELATAYAGASPNQQQQVGLAQAVLAAAEGDRSAAEAGARPLSSPAAKELLAIAAYRQSPKGGLGRLVGFLSQSQVSGVPRVVEPTGIRFVGDFGGKERPLEASVTEPLLAGMLARRLAEGAGVPSRAANGAADGVVVSSPPAVVAGDPLPQPLEDRLWAQLAIQPSYKLAEYLVAEGEAKEGHPDHARDHFLVAAALDPSYRDVRRQLTAAFRGIARDRFPHPAGVKLPTFAAVAPQNHNMGFWVGDPKVREIALTFDDGPNPGTPRMLTALRRAGAKATFFVVGARAMDTPDVVRQMAAQGDEVEDHSYTHPNLDEALPDHILEEVLRCAVVVRALAGRWPSFFRPPGGDADPHVLAAARQCGMAGAFWTVDALSAEDSGSGQAVCRLVVSHARPGAIVLMHNGIPATIAAIPALVRDLRAKGYHLVTLRQLARDSH